MNQMEQYDREEWERIQRLEVTDRIAEFVRNRILMATDLGWDKYIKEVY